MRCFSGKTHLLRLELQNAYVGKLPFPLQTLLKWIFTVVRLRTFGNGVPAFTIAVGKHHELGTLPLEAFAKLWHNRIVVAAVGNEFGQRLRGLFFSVHDKGMAAASIFLKLAKPPAEVFCVRVS